MPGEALDDVGVRSGLHVGDRLRLWHRQAHLDERGHLQIRVERQFHSLHQLLPVHGDHRSRHASRGVVVASTREGYSTISRSVEVRPNVSGEYISSARVGGTTNEPGVVARATYEYV